MITKPEKDEEHYFSVQLDGVDTNSRLLSYADVEDYLTQNAPVPYSPDFVWGKEIVKRLQNEGLTISSYNISLEYGTRVATLYKPYRDEFIVDKGKNITDVVQDIQVVKIPNDRETLTAIGWLAKTSYKGSIYEKAVTDGRRIQIKATQIKRIAISSEPDYLIVTKILDCGDWEEIYNGPGGLAWNAAGKLQKMVSVQYPWQSLKHL